MIVIRKPSASTLGYTIGLDGLFPSKSFKEQNPPSAVELTPVCETGIKNTLQVKQPVVDNQSVTGCLVLFECELSYSK
jgi:glutathione peroxidase-family protein